MNHKPHTYNALLNHLAELNDSSEIGALLDALLTDKEQKDINNRILIFDLIEQGKTQREIAKELQVGIATVSRGAKAAKQHDTSALIAALKR